MPRTTSEQVSGIIEVDPDIDLTPFILPANELVTEICALKGYSTTRLELIERYLSAHFYTLRDPRTVSEQAGSVQAQYQSKVDLYLSTSHYGQMAMFLDSAGGLAGWNNTAAIIRRKVTPGVFFVGSDCRHSIPCTPASTAASASSSSSSSGTSNTDFAGISWHHGSGNPPTDGTVQEDGYIDDDTGARFINVNWPNSSNPDWEPI